MGACIKAMELERIEQSRSIFLSKNNGFFSNNIFLTENPQKIGMHKKENKSRNSSSEGVALFI